MSYGEHLSDHSQWGEQKIILDFFGDYVGRFLDLGAFDGIGGSNSRGLTDRHWSGVCVEASPFTFQRLVSNHAGNPKVENEMPALMRLMAKDMMGKNGLAAIREMLDRSHGKPKQVADVTTKGESINTGLLALPVEKQAEILRLINGDDPK